MLERTHSRIRAHSVRSTGLLGLLLFLLIPLFLFGASHDVTGAGASTKSLANAGSSVSSANAAHSLNQSPVSGPSQPSTLPPIPAGMPTYFDFGLFNGDISDVPAAVPWDYRYQYLTGGVNTGDGWATWNNPPGQYATNYINDARDRGMTPAFQYYQILESAPNYDEYQNMQDSSTMYDYFADWELLMTKCGQAGGPIVVMLEADLTGTLQQDATNDDATTVSAHVASSGYPDAAGYANNFKGMYQAMLHIRDLYAPNTLITLDVSNWGEGDDIVLALRDNPGYDWQHHADRTAAFLNSLGSGFDMLSWNPADRDAAYYQITQGSNRWWDDNNVTQPTYNTMGAWLGRIVTDTNKRVVLWQVPNGNKVYRSENNTDGHYQDNKTDYFLNPTNGRQHIQDWANLGVLGIWWGAGAGGQSHYYDANGDGITNPAPINGNNEVALYADDDGGFIRVQSTAYYALGAVPLPGGAPSTPTRTRTPTPTVTGTPPTPTRTRTPTATPVCGIAFEDVPVGSTFYAFVTCLLCHDIVGGYPCGGPGEPCNPANDPYFRPNGTITRGQVAKIVSLAAGFNEQVSTRTFQDVARGSTFYVYVERLAARGIMAGYACGGPGESCVPPNNRPYFRPNRSATRGQIAKIVAKAANFNETVTSQTFQDVAPGSTFYSYIERLASRGIIGGYACGRSGEPCVPPNNRPYFRPNGTVTRGQTSKIGSSAFFPQCAIP